MKRLVAALAAVLLLAGCAGAPAPKAASTSKADPNIAACNEFVTTFQMLTKANTDRNANTITIDAWRAIVDDAGTDYAGVSAKARGDVKVRIDSLVDTIDANPAGIRGFLFTGTAADEYEAKLKRVGQACTVAGVKVSFTSK